MIPYMKLSKVQFPTFTGVNINMMPIIFGDHNSVPESIARYLPLINKCNFKRGDTVYLSVHESFVEEGQTQRRGGIHTEATKIGPWGGPWGGSLWPDNQGVYMASTDGACRIWSTTTTNVDKHGEVQEKLKGYVQNMEAHTMYWLCDTTPHESLPVKHSGNRQWFRLVSPKIFGWYSKHNTANPLGVLPNCPIIDSDKFKSSCL